MRRRVNYIGKIRRSGRAFESLHKIKEEVTQFYEDLYKSYASVRPKLDGLSFPSISSDTRSWWERKFEEDEVRRALEECDGDKAPGPDGFNFSFITAGRDFFKDDFVNGSPSKFFKASRGIRHEGPLSPFPFTIVAEALSFVLVKEKDVGLIGGFEMGWSCEIIMHLQFIDDTILFSSSRRDEILALRRILRCFQLVSSLKINISKSMLVGIGCSEETTRSLVNIINRKSGKLSIIYLGLPIGAKPRSKSLWDPVIENFKRKLASWKKLYLSLGGRITLIKACMSNLPIYYISLQNAKGGD
ncbi:hypothetical protein AAC387_Pa08g1737 [Persea americana]